MRRSYRFPGRLSSFAPLGRVSRRRCAALGSALLLLFLIACVAVRQPIDEDVRDIFEMEIKVPKPFGEQKSPSRARPETFLFSPDEEDDIFLRRPNWRRRRLRSDGDDDEIRIMILVFNTKLDMVACTALASGLLSGLPVVLMGDGSEFTSYLDKTHMARKVVDNAQLRERDIVMVMDADLVFSSGAALTDSLDRYIALSPETPEELDARAVRDGRGTMLAPFILSADTHCWLLYLARTRDATDCMKLVNTSGQTVFDQYAKQLFPDTYRSMTEWNYPYVNGGFFVGRVWAFKEYYVAFTRFVKLQLNINERGVRTKYYDDDQSVSNGLFLALLHWEASADMLSEDNRDLAKTQRGPYGLRPGLLEMDYHNEFITVTLRRYYANNRITDRLWHPENALKVAAAMRASVANFMVLHHATGGQPVGGKAVRGDWVLKTTANDGLANVSKVYIPSVAPRKFHCEVLKMFLEATGSSSTINAAVQPECTGTDGMNALKAHPTRPSAAFFYAHPVPRSRAPGVTTIAMAPPTVASWPWRDPGRSSTLVFAPIVHFAGPRKAMQLNSYLRVVPWGVPMYFSAVPRDHPDSAVSRARAYLRSMPMEIWTDTHRRRANFSDICMPWMIWL